MIGTSINETTHSGLKNPKKKLLFVELQNGILKAFSLPNSQFNAFLNFLKL